MGKYSMEDIGKYKYPDGNVANPEDGWKYYAVGKYVSERYAKLAITETANRAIDLIDRQQKMQRDINQLKKDIDVLNQKIDSLCTILNRR